MVINQNTKINSSELRDILNSHRNTVIKLDKRMIEDDINKLKQRLVKDNLSKISIKNINSIIQYLDKLMKIKADDEGYISMRWKLDAFGRVSSSPVKLRKFSDYGIDAVDYISISDTRTIISVEYTDLMNCMALEISKEDFGVDLNEIDKQLGSILAISDVEKLKEMGLLHNMYRTLLSAKVNNSGYKSIDDGVLYSYFGNRVDSSKGYRGMIEDSMQTALQVIISNQIPRFIRGNTIKASIISISEDRIAYAVPVQYLKEVEEVLQESIITRVIGRKFEIKPEIKVY